MPGATNPPDGRAGGPPEGGLSSQRGGACQDGHAGHAGHSERLRVPLRWWVQATMFLATLWLAFIVATPEWLAWTATGVVVAVTYGLFLLVGSVRVEVRDGELHAGAAHIDLRLLGTPEVLDPAGTRRVAGVDADARAHLVLRPYLKRSVRVPVVDPADPTPYWLISTRRPGALAAAITDGRGGPDRG